MHSGRRAWRLLPEPKGDCGGGEGRYLRLAAQKAGLLCGGDATHDGRHPDPQRLRHPLQVLAHLQTHHQLNLWRFPPIFTEG